MTFEELKENVQQLISRAKTEQAIDSIAKWAKKNHHDNLKKDISLIEGKYTSLASKRNLGLISTSEIAMGESKISYSVLSLFDNLDKNDPIKEDDDATIDVSGQMKILMLTANPETTAKLNLDKEYAFIVRKLQQKQDQFKIILKKAVSGSEFKEFTQQEKPDILHFAGHGEKGKYAGIVVHNDDKNGEDVIEIPGLKALFKFFDNLSKKKAENQFKIKVVLLNACYTEDQAKTISEYVEYVIGTNVAIGDVAACAFSSGFYFQLAEDEPMNIETAFESGRTEAVLKGAAEANFVIYREGKLLEIS